MSTFDNDCRQLHYQTIRARLIALGCKVAKGSTREELCAKLAAYVREHGNGRQQWTESLKAALVQALRAQYSIQSRRRSASASLNEQQLSQLSDAEDDAKMNVQYVQAQIDDLEKRNKTMIENAFQAWERRQQQKFQTLTSKVDHQQSEIQQLKQQQATLQQSITNQRTTDLEGQITVLGRQLNELKQRQEQQSNNASQVPQPPSISTQRAISALQAQIQQLESQRQKLTPIAAVTVGKQDERKLDTPSSFSSATTPELETVVDDRFDLERTIATQTALIRKLRDENSLLQQKHQLYSTPQKIEIQVQYPPSLTSPGSRQTVTEMRNDLNRVLSQLAIMQQTTSAVVNQVRAAVKTTPTAQAVDASTLLLLQDDLRDLRSQQTTAQSLLNQLTASSQTQQLERSLPASDNDNLNDIRSRITQLELNSHNTVLEVTRQLHELQSRSDARTLQLQDQVAAVSDRLFQQQQQQQQALMTKAETPSFTIEEETKESHDLDEKSLEDQDALPLSLSSTESTSTPGASSIQSSLSPSRFTPNSSPVSSVSGSTKANNRVIGLAKLVQSFVDVLDKLVPNVEAFNYLAKRDAIFEKVFPDLRRRMKRLAQTKQNSLEYVWRQVDVIREQFLTPLYITEMINGVSERVVEVNSQTMLTIKQSLDVLQREIKKASGFGDSGDGSSSTSTMSTANQNAASGDDTPVFRPEAVDDDAKHGLDALAGLEDAKHIIRQRFLAPLQYPKLFPVFPKGVLLYGTAGGGKTSIVKAMVYELREVAVLFAPNVGMLKSKFEGGTEKAISALFAAARDYLSNPPSDHKYGHPKIAIIFLDELEAIAASRESGDASLTRTVTTLLQEMDGISSDGNVLVVGATNFPKRIDTAISRRLPVKVEIPIGDVEAIAEMMRQKIVTRYRLDKSSTEQYEFVMKLISMYGRTLPSRIEYTERVGFAGKLKQTSPSKPTFISGVLSRLQSIDANSTQREMDVKVIQQDLVHSRWVLRRRDVMWIAELMGPSAKISPANPYAYVVGDRFPFGLSLSDASNIMDAVFIEAGSQTLEDISPDGQSAGVQEISPGVWIERYDYPGVSTYDSRAYTAKIAVPDASLDNDAITVANKANSFIYTDDEINNLSDHLENLPADPDEADEDEHNDTSEHKGSDENHLDDEKVDSETESRRAAKRAAVHKIVAQHADSLLSFNIRLGQVLTTLSNWQSTVSKEDVQRIQNYTQNKE